MAPWRAQILDFQLPALKKNNSTQLLKFLKTADVWAQSRTILRTGQCEKDALHDPGPLNSSDGDGEHVAARHATRPFVESQLIERLDRGKGGKGRQQSPSTTPIGLGGAQLFDRRRGGRGGRAGGGGGKA